MKSTRTILFLLMLGFVSACSSTTSTPTSSPTNTPSSIVEATVTLTSPAPTEIATVVAPTADIGSTEAGTAAIKLFEQIKVDPSTYDLKIDGNVIVGIDKATGKEIFRDGKFELHYAVQAAVNSGELVPTKYKPRPVSSVGVPNSPPINMTAEYIIPVVAARMRAEFKKTTGSDPVVMGKSVLVVMMIDPSQLAWGYVTEMEKNNPDTQQYLVYETKGNGIAIVPVESGSFVEAQNFWNQ